MMNGQSVKKNPVTIIRDPEKINKEYSDIVIKLGNFELELEAIKKAQDHQNNRRLNIAKEKETLFLKVKELSEEMSEAQKEIQRKEELAKKESTPSQEITQ